MKKKYLKPEITVERFNFQQSIADNCSHDYDTSLGHPTHGNPSTCAWDHGGVTTWTQAVDACVSEKEDPDYEIGGGCYNTPSGSIRLFASY